MTRGNPDIVATAQPDRRCVHADCAAFACQREPAEVQRPWLHRDAASPTEQTTQRTE